MLEIAWRLIRTRIESTQGSAGIPAEPGYRPVFDVFVPVPVPAGITILAGILAGIFYQKIGSFH